MVNVSAPTRDLSLKSTFTTEILLNFALKPAVQPVVTSIRSTSRKAKLCDHERQGSLHIVPRSR